jgi:hypothetical protein
MISSTGPNLTPDLYEPNEQDTTAASLYSFKLLGGGITGGIIGAFAIDPRVTIDANLHSTADIDYYIVRGAPVTLSDLVFLVGYPAVRIIGNESPVSMEVYRVNPDGTRGPLVAASSGGGCTAVPVRAQIEEGVLYFVRLVGGTGRYVLRNGVDGDSRKFPILVRDHIYVILHPGEPVERVIRYPEWYVFVADPGYARVRAIGNGINMKLYDFDGVLVNEGDGELDLGVTVTNNVYAILLTPPEDEPEQPFEIEWDATTATRVSANLVMNPGAEAPPEMGDDNGIPGWNGISDVVPPQVYLYDSESSEITPTDPGPEDRGLYYFAGGDTVFTDMGQVITIDPAWRQAIDAGRVRFRFAAYLGGILAEGDHAEASVTFRNTQSQSLGVQKLPSITPVERENMTGLFPVEESGVVPAGTTSVHVAVSFHRVVGFFNDCFVDNIEFILAEY